MSTETTTNGQEPAVVNEPKAAPLNLVKRGDLFKVPFSQMDADFDANIRFDYGDIEQLAGSIKENGVIKELRAYKNKAGRYQITDGFRRYKAMQLLFERDKLDVVAKVTLEDKGTSEEQRLIEMLLSGEGKNYEPLEIGHVYLRLKKVGYSAKKISDRVNQSPAYVGRLIKLAEAPQVVQNLITNKTIAATYASELLRKRDINELVAEIEAGAFVPPTTEVLEDTTGDDIGADGGNKAKAPAKSGGKTSTITKGKQEQNSYANLKKYLKAAEGFEITWPKTKLGRAEVFDFLNKLANNKLSQKQIEKFLEED